MTASRDAVRILTFALACAFGVACGDAGNEAPQPVVADRGPSAAAAEARAAAAPVLVMTAMPVELAPLLEVAEIDERVVINGRTHHVGSLGGVEVVMVAAGISMVNAAMGAQAAIDRFAPRTIVYCGIAGGANPDIRVGDVTVPARWAQYQEHVFTDSSRTGWRRGWRSEALGNFGMMYPQRVRVAHDGAEPDSEELMLWFPVDEPLLRAAGEVAEITPLDRCDASGQCLEYEPRVLLGGNGVSGPTFVDDPEYREWAWETFQTDAFDMETAAVAHVALSNGVPYIGVRAVSDMAGGTPHENRVESHTPLATANAAKVVVALVGVLTP